MTSGFGIDGGPGRCFPFWQEVMACHVLNRDPDDRDRIRMRELCGPAIQDYLECLHHRKENARILNLQAKYRARMSEDPRASVFDGGNPSSLSYIPTATDIQRLGVLDVPDEEKDIRPFSVFGWQRVNGQWVNSGDTAGAGASATNDRDSVNFEKSKQAPTK